MRRERNERERERERERESERGKNEDGREIEWMKDMEKERMDRKRNRWRIGKNANFWNCIVMFVIRNPKPRRQ
jgi:hypothetical protein